MATPQPPPPPPGGARAGGQRPRQRFVDLQWASHFGPLFITFMCFLPRMCVGGGGGGMPGPSQQKRAGLADGRRGHTIDGHVCAFQRHALDVCLRDVRRTDHCLLVSGCRPRRCCRIGRTRVRTADQKVCGQLHYHSATTNPDTICSPHCLDPCLPLTKNPKCVFLSD